MLLLPVFLCLQACPEKSEYPLTNTAQYTNGVLMATYDRDITITFKAAQAALRDFDIKITNAKKNGNQSEINATRPDGTNITILMRSHGRDITTTAIKVGPSGEDEFSHELSKRIEEHLS